MTDKNNKKIFTRHPAVTKFLVVFLTGSFLFGNNALAVNDYTKATGATPISTSWNNSVSNYDKPLNGSLSAPEWNGLFYDFVNTWTTANMAGPLGIGSASPSAALDIFSKVKITSGGIIYNTDSGRYLDMSGVLSDSLKVSGNLYSTAGVLKIDGTGNNYLMGNVGIGTVSPAAALHVNYPTSGSAIFQVGTADGGSNADIKLGYNGYGWYWRYLGSGAGDNNELQLWSEGAGGTDQQAYGIKQSGIITFPKNVYFGGNVGISTTTPTSALDVNGLIKMRSYTISQPEDVINKSYLDSALSSSTASIITQVATSSFWQGSLTGNVYNSNTGNVGIGITNPGEKLQVIGNGLFSTDSSLSGWQAPGGGAVNGQVRVKPYGNRSLSIEGINTADGYPFNGHMFYSALTNNNSSGGFLFRSGSTDVLAISSNANVGIGTTTPAARLHISSSAARILLESNDATTNGQASVRLKTNASEWMMFSQNTGTGNLNFYHVNSGYTPLSIESSAPSNTLYLKSNGNVGIGTTNPLFKLDVNGTAQFNNSVIVGTPTANNHAATKSYVDSVALSSSGGGVGSGTSGQTLRHDGTSWIANSNLFNNGTNIGIGTTTPLYKLEVVGTAKISSTLTVGSTVSAARFSPTSSTISGNSLYLPTSNTIGFSTASLERMRIDSTGNIGVGTTTPAYKLDVNGTAQFTNSVIVGTPTAASHAATKSYVDSAAGGGVGTGTSGQTLRHNGTNWVANSTLYNNGTNIGIGTTGPGSKLDVRGGVNITGASGFSEGIRLHAVGGISSVWFNAVSNSGFDSGMFGITTDTTGMRFRYGTGASPSDLVNISNNGNVGINTTTPAFKLDVNGTAQFTNSVIVGTPTAASHAATKSYVDSAAGGGVGAGTSGQTLRHNGTNWIANSTLYNNGTNVGIGTASPGMKLSVQSSLSGGSFEVIGSNDGYANIDIKGNRTVNSLGGIRAIRVGDTAAFFEMNPQADRSATYFSTGNGTTSVSPKVTLLQGGNVGIGTTTPAFKLDVNGTAQFTNSVIVGTPTAANHAATKSYVDSAAASAAGSTWTLSGNNIYNSNSGNIGIGTSNLSSKLHVVGKTQITDGVALADTQYYSTFGVTREASSSPLTYIAMTRAGSAVRGIGIDSSNNIILGAPTANTQVISSPWMVINSSSVGIGSTVPAFKLDVAGTAQFTNSVIVGTPTAASHAATKSYVDSAAGGGVGTGTSGQTLRHNGTSWIANSTLYNNGTNIGIGTTGPIYKLDVSGSTNILARFAGTYTGVQGIRVERIGGDNVRLTANYLGFGGGLESSSTLRFAVNNNDISSPAMFINTDGNLGIGTTNPLFKLDVAGTAQFTNSVIVGTPTAASHAATKSYVDSAAGGGVGAGTSGQTLRHNGTNWVSNSSLYNNGTNVGIGTTAATSKLTVAGDIKHTGMMTSQGANYSFSWMKFDQDINGNSLILGSGGLTSIGAGESSDLVRANVAATTETLYLASDNDIAFRTNLQSSWASSTAAMNISAIGNVGIGSVNPTAKLYVNGTAQFTNSVIVGTPTATNHATTKSYVDSAVSGVGGGIGTGTSGQTLRNNGTSWVSSSALYNNGTNIGINSAIPLVRLTVNQGSYNWPATSTTIQTGGFRIQAESGGNVTLDAGVNGASGAWLQTTNRTDLSQEYPLMLNPNGGNVGVGTTVASYNLDVTGTGRFTNTVTVGTPTAASHAATKSYVDSTAGGGVGSGTSGQTLRHNGTSWIANSNFYNNGTNIGIGTTTPTEKLEVNGRLKIGNNTVSGENITFDGSTSAGMRVANSSGYISITPLNSSWAHIYTDRYNFIFDKPVYSIAGKFSAYNTSNLELQTAGTTRMTLNATTGYVGIGTTTPDFKLDVAGTAQFTNSVIVGTPTAASHATTKSYVDSAVSGVGGGISTGTSGQTLRHNGTSWVSNSVLYNNGTNVGVGTTNPGSKLEVYGGSIKINGGDINFAMTAGQTATKLVSYSNASGLWMIQPTSQSLILADAVDWDRSAAIQYTPGTTGALAGRLMIGQTAKNSANYTHGITSLYTSGVEQLRINSSGNVGIGTTTPTFKLDVVGTAQFSQPVIVGTPTAINHAATKSYVDSTASSAAGGGVGTGTSGQTLRHNGTSWISNSVLYNNGTNIGIGTISPRGKLDVGGFYATNYISSSTSWVGTPAAQFIPLGTFNANSDVKIVLNLDGCGFGGSALEYMVNKGYGGVPRVYYMGPSSYDSAPRGLDSRVSFKYEIIGNTSYYLGVTVTGGCNDSGRTVGATMSVVGGADFSSVDSNSANYTALTAYQYLYNGYEGAVSFGNVVTVGTPTAASHAATKSYVDSTASSAAGGGVGSGTSGQTLRHNGTSWISNSALYNNGTNIGIGTGAPATKLHVYNAVDGVFNGLVIDNRKAYGVGTGINETSRLILSLSESTVTDPTSRVFGYVEAGTNSENSSSDGWLAFGSRLSGVATEKMRINSAGNVGIGTNNPVAALDIFSKLKLTSGGTIYNTDSARWLDMTGTLTDSLKASGDFYSTAGRLKMNGTGVSYVMGTFGVGTATPSKTMQVFGASASFRVGPNYTDPDRDYIDVLSGGTNSTIQTNNEGFIFNNLGGPLTLQTSGGNVGIATTTPTEAKLVISAGTGMAIKAYGNGIFTGTLQTQTGSDFAEEFSTTKDLEPGTVVVMDDNGHKSVKPCAKSYDKTVVGIVSNDPSIIAGRVESKHKAIIAMMGVVKVKVSDINGKISKGDLLTTSGITGYAMKAQDSKPGTIIGKALENLTSSNGQINVLVNLQ